MTRMICDGRPASTFRRRPDTATPPEQQYIYPFLIFVKVQIIQIALADNCFGSNELVILNGKVKWLFN